MKNSVSLLGAAMAAGLSLSLGAQTAPTTPAEAPATMSPAATPASPSATPATTNAPEAAAQRPAQRAAAPQRVGGIQAADDKAKDSYTFFFGNGDAPAGATKLAPDMVYSDERGYGFESGATIAVVDKDKAAKNGGVITSDRQFFIDAAAPEGNYKVTVTLGHPDRATTTTVKGELLRTFLDNVTTKPGEYITKTFIVNTRRPEYPGGAVRLKAPRESQQEAWNWDKGLTLEFNGDHPSVAALKIEKASVPTIYLVGDSTSCDQMAEPYSSWGQMFTSLMKPEVAVANHGESGESYAAALGARRFDKVWSLAKPGDFILTQFGHNDQKAAGGVEVYSQNIRRVIAETKKTGAQLVIITPVSRAPGAANLDAYAAACRQIAAEEKIPVLDLYTASQTLYGAFGERAVVLDTLFADKGPNAAPPRYDATHHGPFGSYEVAKIVASLAQQNKLEFAKYLADGFAFDPAKPDKKADFKIPSTKQASAEKPPGS